MKTSVIIPTLNELKGIQAILPQIKKEWYEQIIILDGHSKDHLWKWYLDNVNELRDKKIDIFIQSGNGLWNAYQELFASNIVKGDMVITLSPDFNCPPEDIPKLEHEMEKGLYDMVIASRYYQGAKSQDDTKLTALGNRFLTWLCNLSSGFTYTDGLNMYRAYKKSMIDDLMFAEKLNWLQRRLAKMTSLFSFEPSLSIRAGKIPLRIAEIQSEEPKAYRERRQNTFVHGFAILTQIVYESWFR